MIDTTGVQIKRNRKYEGVVDKLCGRKNPYTGKPLFNYNKDLMVFAAMVGYTHGVKEELEPEGIQIVLHTYATDEKDGFIYLIALLEKQEAICLKDDNIVDSVKYFELYCNGGLSIIKQWLDDNPGDADALDTLMDKAFERITIDKGILSSRDLPKPVW
ncbi:hypothetical protein I5Q41_17360 [Pseudomonas monteilii]|uniref:hypothetical protein n=1 Tax=Pseudomonas TaxID=286 RepID=UPI00048CF151|nr:MULTISPECIES: hypothetical protein [Pseudomonas]MBH3456452.1 hypothetical protein [Pseudomonas monteilii]